MRQILLIMLSLFIMVNCIIDTTSQNKFPPQLASQLQSELDEWASESHHMGVSAAIIINDGSEWVGTAGISASGQALKSDQLIWIASITKTMTGAIVLKLAEQDKLSLDDPVSKWKPDLKNINPSVTIKQLLNHTNGLDNYTKNQELWTTANNDPMHVFTAAELISYVGPNVFEPGERTQYTNTSFVLLGLIAEKASQKPLVELYHDMLWGPLGMDHIFLPGHEDPPSEIASAWLLTRDTTRQIAPMSLMSTISTGSYAFGLFSNAETVCRWGRAFFTGTIINESTKAEMIDLVPAAGNIPGESGAGLGIRGYNFLDRDQLGHSGGSPLGSSLMIYDIESGVTVTVIMNQGARAQHFVLAPKLLEISSR